MQDERVDLLIPENLTMPMRLRAYGDSTQLLSNEGLHCNINLGNGMMLSCRVTDGLISRKPNARALAATAYLGFAFALSGDVVLARLDPVQAAEVIMCVNQNVSS